MKRFLRMMMLILLAALLTSCRAGDSTPCTDIAARVCERCDFLPGTPGVYFHGAEEGEKGFLPPERLCAVYAKEPGCDELALIDDYCIIFSRRSSCAELHILRARTTSGRDRLAVMLRRRADELGAGEYIPFGQEPLGGSKAQTLVFTKGHFAFLIVAPDTQSVRKAIDAVT